MDDDEKLLAEFDRELEVLAALEPLTIVLTRIDSLLLLTLLQLVLRSEYVEGAGRELGMKLADTLENAVGVTPALRDITRRGWGNP